MTPVEKYQQIKSRAENMQLQINRAEGALAQQMARLKKEHGCDTLPEARKKLQKLNKDSQTLKDGFEAAVKTFEETWGDILEASS